MDEIIGAVLRVLVRILMELVNWIPQPRWDSIGGAWAWPIAICLAVALTALVAACCFGYPWLYLLCLGASVGVFGFVCVAAICSGR